MNTSQPNATARRVTRAVHVGLLCVLVSCADNPYRIGTLREPAVDAGLPALDCAEHAEALVCSNFEQPDLADWPMTEVTGPQALIESAAELAYSGARGLHASTSGPQSTAVVAREFTAVDSGTLYLRAFVRIPAEDDTQTVNLFFVGLEPDETDGLPFTGLDVNVENGALQIYSPQNAPSRVTGTLTVPRDRYFCLGGRVDVGDAGAVTLTIDGEEALVVAPFDTLPEGGIRLFRAGIDWSSEQTTPFDVYMDDLILSQTPVDCPLP